jgi:leucyl-tRNA synthetase
MGEEIWEALGHASTICDAAWPPYDPEKLEAPTIVVAVQVNGKLRGQVEVAADADGPTAIAAAKVNAGVAKWLEGKVLQREIYVPGRLVNLVVK